MNANQNQDRTDQGRHAVVGVIFEDGKFLVIRRSQWVRAPGLICFPGGGIEADETLEEAVSRELLEELQLPVEVLGHLWTSETRWGTRLEWMTCRRNRLHEPDLNENEVEAILWLTYDELIGRSDLLGSMPEFLQGWISGELSDRHFSYGKLKIEDE